jgi:hypothetical protein
VNYVTRYITFNGALAVPVLTMHTTGDPMATVQTEQAYASVVDWAGDADMLRQVFIDRAGHCAFTPAEILTGLHTLIQRVESGKWGATTNSGHLNQDAAQFGAPYNVLFSPAGTVTGVTPAFIPYHPAPFLRPYDIRNQ